MFWRKISLGIFFLSCLLLVYAPIGWTQVDNTNCTVSSTKDDNSFNTLRRKIEDGFNRSFDRACTELIKFNGNKSSEPMTIKLAAPLKILGENDGDCTFNGHPLCGDGINFEIDGTTHPGGVIIDTTGLTDDRCAIEITGNHHVYKGLTIKSKQSELVGRKTKNGEETVLPDAVICENGNDLNFDDVELDTDQTTAAPVCGNGVVEDGEECDEGSNNGPSSTCNENCQQSTVTDTDGDGILDDVDNCPNDKNPDQSDCDGDGKGDLCDNDWDNDGWADGLDNCPPNHNICDKNELAKSANPDQANTDESSEIGTKYGDLCDDDIDGDGIPNDDNGDGVPNTNPTDNLCTGGETSNCFDNCSMIPNPDQEDNDSDGIGLACDPDDLPPAQDSDGDGVSDDLDNCIDVPNGPNEKDIPGVGNQTDTDSDTIGDACDDDIDGDQISNADEDAAVAAAEPGKECLDKFNSDSDGDTLLDGEDPCPCDPDPSCGGHGTTQPPSDDIDNDGILNNVDNCPMTPNRDQSDSDGDGVGDACDPDNPTADSDNDGILNADDNCPTVANPGQENQDGDSQGDACDPQPNVAQDQGVDANVGQSGGGCSLNPAAGNGMESMALLLLLTGILMSLRTRPRGDF